LLKSIGILGGTFNPPHLGHLMMANEVLHALKLDEIWFMPSYIPPHKTIKEPIEPYHRLQMLKLAIEEHDQFTLQPIEFQRKEPSYTYDTMRILTEKYPAYQFHFIIGADMVEYLPKWYEIDELVNLVTFVGVKRPGYTITSPYPIKEVEVPQFDVSSSFIRERVVKKETIRYFIPAVVKQYIEENQLYESN
jgi:nicotinate-nucleotide adenylyltransferase